MLWLRYLAAFSGALLLLLALRLPGPWGPRLAALPLAALLAWLALRPPRPAASLRAHAAALLASALLILGAEVAAIHAVGLQEHREQAPFILVLGAKVHEDGTPSEALAERVATGVTLFKQGLSPRLLVSGGVGREGQDEARVMKRIAVGLGVPEEAIVTDSEGTNTEASIRNARRALGALGARRLLVVSHYHHLPRVRLLGALHGVECLTVPADEGETLLAGTPFYVLREAAGLLFYAVRG